MGNGFVFPNDEVIDLHDALLYCRPGKGAAGDAVLNGLKYVAPVFLFVGGICIATYLAPIFLEKLDDWKRKEIEMQDVQ